MAKIKSKLYTLRSRPVFFVLFGAGFCIDLLIGGLLVSYAVPRTIAISYASGQSCILSPIVLPNSDSTDAKAPYALRFARTFSVAHVLLFAGEICAIPQEAPRAGAAYDDMFALSHVSTFRKRITVAAPAYIRVTAPTVTKPLVLTDSLAFQVSQPDVTFAYVLSANGQRSRCALRQLQLVCPLQQLALQYGQHYTARLMRTFGQLDVQAAAQVDFQTITATTVTSSSIADGSTVYDKPQQLTLQTDKPIASLGSVALAVVKADGTSQALPASAAFSTNIITVSAAQTLPRKSTIRLTISSLKAQDGSGLVAPYTLSFTVSGGPRVISVTLPAYNAIAQAITMSFDQALDPGQGTSQVVFQANGTSVSARMTISGNRIIISPQQSYPLCAHLTLSVGSAIASPYGISGDSAYTYTARAQCHTTFSIGSSVQGRAITAYKIGSGSAQLLFIGTMHGNEQNAGLLLDKWLNDLEANVDSIPVGRSIVIIPRINPDGAVANSRLNADNVDLNRNFPADSWKSVVTEPDGATGPFGSSSALSEPESQALAAYMQAQRPRITVDYHSHAGVVQGNDGGDADALALRYALTSGYSDISAGASGSVFDYDTTGSFEDWTNQRLSLPEFLVELASATNDEFSRNRTALWNLVQEPLP